MQVVDDVTRTVSRQPTFLFMSNIRSAFFFFFTLYHSGIFVSLCHFNRRLSALGDFRN